MMSLYVLLNNQLGCPMLVCRIIIFLKQVQNSKKHSSIPIPAPILLRVRELAEMQSQVSPVLKAVKYDGHSGRRHVNDIKSGFL